MKRNTLLLIIAILTNYVITYAAVVESVWCGDSISWVLNEKAPEKYELTIFGAGNIEECSFPKYAQTIIIKNGVTGIGSHAFDGCSGLTSVTIPNSVTNIGNYAFSSCNGLTSVTIGNSVTSIGDGAFAGCQQLTSITIPNSVRSIGEAAFLDCWKLKFITIPNDVTSIGSGAFYCCEDLTTIIIPKSVTSIGEMAFFGCRKLTSLKVESGNPIYDSRDNCNGIIETASNKLITGTNKTIIPISVTSIGDGAFAGCSTKTFTIPDNITSIGKWAFLECDMDSIIIPNSVVSIGENAFYRCRNLTSITIPNSVTNIGDTAFHECEHLTSITIPNSITTIGNSLFSNCRNLSNISIPNSVTTIKARAFWNCESLTSITIPNSVTSIGEEAFRYCENLAYLFIPASVEYIGDDAFSDCPSLSIALPYWFRESASIKKYKNITFYHPDDDDLWNMAQNENTEESYKKYLRYTETRKHYMEANIALDKIYSSPEWIEANMWKTVVNSNNSKEYLAYLSQYPQGKYAIDAKMWLWDNDEDKCWLDFVLRNDDIESFDVYLKLYPIGKYKDQAEERKENLAWEKAKKMNTIDSYDNYLKIYTQGKYVAEATKQRSIVEDKILWKQTVENASLSAYKRYAETTGTHVNEAKEIIAEMERNGESYNYVVNVGPRDQKVFYDMFLRYPCGNKALSWKYNFGKLKSIAKKEGMLNSVNDKDKDRFLCNTEYNHISVHHYSKPDRIEIFGSYKNIFGVSKITVLVERLAKIGVVWGNNTPDLYGKYKGTYLYEDINVNIELSENNVIVYALKKR